MGQPDLNTSYPPSRSLARHNTLRAAILRSCLPQINRVRHSHGAVNEPRCPRDCRTVLGEGDIEPVLNPIATRGRLGGGRDSSCGRSRIPRLRYFLGERKYQQNFIRFVAPFSLIGLLYTIIVLFASQGAHVVEQITSVLRVCAPLVVYFLTIFPLTAYMMWRSGFGYRVSATQSFTAASNNFELAIAVVVAVYGAGSKQALAATVGPLIEVPVLVGLVYVIRYFKHRWGWKDDDRQVVVHV